MCCNDTVMKLFKEALLLVCLFFSSCVECLAFGSGPFEKNCSDSCSNITLESKAQPKSIHCRDKDSKNCWISYTMFRNDGEEHYSITVNREKGMLSATSPKTNICSPL